MEIPGTEWIPSVGWVSIIALVAFVMGINNAWNALKKLRSWHPVEKPLAYWTEEPRSLLKEGVFVPVVLFTRDFFILFLGILVVIAGVRGWNITPDWVNWTTWILYYGVIGVGTGIVWLVIGSAATYPFANPRIRPVGVVLAEEGLYRGQLFIPWSRAAFYRTDAQEQTIQLYSRNCPEIILVTLNPFDPQIYRQALEIIAARVPGQPVESAVPWYRRKAAFGLFYLLVPIPFLLLCIWIYLHGIFWLWFACGFSVFAILKLGNYIIRAYH